MGTSAFTGMIADFVAPIAPTGWLELDGSTISTSTFSALYGVMTIQTSGTRNNGSPTITSIPSTTSFKVGYFVFGTGIPSGTTVLSIDSGTQITLSGNATSTGSGTFAVSPWLLNTGTIQLPDVTTAGRYRRSRTSSTAVGQVQADTVVAHTHTISGSGTTSIENVNHNHSFSGSGSASVTSTDWVAANTLSSTGQSVSAGANGISVVLGGGVIEKLTSSGTASVSGTTGTESANHSHTVSVTGTAASTGGTENRPITLVVLTCVKT